MDKAAKRLAVIYVILLSLCAPLMAVHFELFTWFMGVVDMSYWTQTVLWFLPMLVYGGILVILGIWNMVKSFQIYKRQDMLGCINGMLIHKYGLVIFFCVNFFWYISCSHLDWSWERGDWHFLLHRSGFRLYW